MSLLSTIASSPLSLSDIAQRDLLQELIADRRSPNMRRMYTKALVDFFMHVANATPTPEAVDLLFQDTTGTNYPHWLILLDPPAQ